MTSAPDGAAATLFSAVVGRPENASSVIYGIITVGAVLAAEGNRNEPYWRSVGAAILILLLYWVVHAWSVDSGDRLEKRRAFEGPAFLAELRAEFSIMRGAVAPIAAVILAGVAGATDQRAVFIGTIVSAMMLVLFEFSVAVLGRLGARQVVIQTAAGGAFGMALIVLRFVVV
ncbi:MAG TPA: hypothetical protein VIE15_03220 [Acidimicrobiales bacterium]